MEHINSYEDLRRVEAYARLEFPGTYYLAYRDLPEIAYRHVKGRKALDFGCGSGRSSRFIKRLGFDTVGVDISAAMIKQARKIDPEGDYHRIENANLSDFNAVSFDLVLSVFTFDNIPHQDKLENLKALVPLLNKDGRIINLVSSPEIYIHEWLSFSTRDFPENKHARSGDRVKIIITDIDDKRAVEDYICFDEDYRQLYDLAGLEILRVYQPLGLLSEPFDWLNESRIPPWVIYVLAKKNSSNRFDKKT